MYGVAEEEALLAKILAWVLTEVCACVWVCVHGAAEEGTLLAKILAGVLTEVGGCACACVCMCMYVSA